MDTQTLIFLTRYWFIVLSYSVAEVAAAMLHVMDKLSIDHRGITPGTAHSDGTCQILQILPWQCANTDEAKKKISKSSLFD